MSANNQDIEKFVNDFTAAEKGPTHDFHNAVQDLMKIQSSSANKQEFQQAMIQFNTELIKNGSLPPLDVNSGNPQAMIVGADKNGNFLMRNFVKDTMMEKDGTTFQTLAEQPMSEIKKGNWGAIDQGQNNNGSGDKPGDGNATPKNKPGDGGSTPGDNTPPASGDSTSAAPHTETWGKREFQVKGDGSAEYQVKSGDTVWSVAADVLKQRTGKQPSAAEIEGEINKIADASGLNKNGRNPGLIYTTDKLVIPGEKPAQPDNAAPSGDAHHPTSGNGSDTGSRPTATDTGSNGQTGRTNDGSATGPVRDPYQFDGSPRPTTTNTDQTNQPRRRSPFDPDPNSLIADNTNNQSTNDATG